MTVSGNSIFSRRSGCAASQSVSPVTDSFRPTTPTMSPADRLLDLLAVVGADVVEPRAVLLLVAAGVVGAAARLQLARIDADEGEVAVGVVGDLEDQAAEGLVGARPARDLGPLLGVVPHDRRLVERAGQVGGDRVQEPLDPHVLEARAAEDRLRAAGQRGTPERGDDLVLGQLGPLQVRHEGLGEGLVEVAQGVEHPLAPELGVGEQVLGDVGLGDGRAEVLGLVIAGPSSRSGRSGPGIRPSSPPARRRWGSGRGWGAPPGAPGSRRRPVRTRRRCGPSC